MDNEVQGQFAWRACEVFNITDHKKQNNTFWDLYVTSPKCKKNSNCL